MKVIIVEDNHQIRDLYKRLLSENFPEIVIAGESDNVSSAVEMTETLKPDLVLLDIELKDGTGFDVLNRVDSRNFSIIFITAFDSFAIKAIKFSAIDYVLKPVEKDEFIKAVNRAVEKNTLSRMEERVKIFIENYERSNQSKKIVLKTSTDMHLINLNDIIFCRSDNNYTTFTISDQNPVTVSKKLKEYEELFDEYNFIRVHNSYLVNLNYVERLDKSDGGFIILKNGHEIPVSSRRKSRLLKLLDKL